jgi:hypothetical protein
MGVGSLKVVDRALLEHVTEQLTETGGKVLVDEQQTVQEEGLVYAPMDAFKVVQATQLPRILYDTVQKKAVHVQNRSVFGQAKDKEVLWRSRYDVILQRIQRDDAYTMLHTEDLEGSAIRLATISSLRGRVGVEHVVLGMLAQLEEGKCYLEDPDASIELDTANCVWRDVKGVTCV